MSINNQHKPGYKHTPLGWIPEEWTIREFGKFASVSNRKYTPVSDEDVKCVELEHIDQGTGFINGFISSTSQKSTKNVFTQGQVLFGKLRPYLKKYWLASFDGVCSSEIWVLTSNSEDCCNSFLFRLIQQHRFIQVANVSSGSKMPRADWDFVTEFPFALPTRPEQGKINSILSTWDEAIIKTQQLIAQLQQRSKGLMQQLLTGKKRLKKFEGQWKKLLIYEIAKEVSLKNKSGKELTVLSCTKYDGLVPSLEYFGRRVFGSDTSTYKVVPQHHFAYATNHIEEGSIGYQARFEEALISPMYTVFKTNEEVYDDYLYKLLKSHQYIHEYCKRMEGSIDRRGGLRWDEFSKIIVHLPELEEQKAIASLLTKANEEVKLYEQKLAALQQQKKGLMQKLLTGEVRVKIVNEKK